MPVGDKALAARAASPPALLLLDGGGDSSRPRLSALPLALALSLSRFARNAGPSTVKNSSSSIGSLMQGRRLLGRTMQHTSR